jgi:hypothetical protein
MSRVKLLNMYMYLKSLFCQGSFLIICQFCFRDVFVSTIQPQRKHVVIMMDHGNSLSPNQLNTAKAIAKHIIRSLSENDRVC